MAATKDALSAKKSLHMIHGLDVARGIVAVHGRWEKARGERFVSFLSYPLLSFLSSKNLVIVKGNCQRLIRRDRY